MSGPASDMGPGKKGVTPDIQDGGVKQRRVESPSEKFYTPIQSTKTSPSKSDGRDSSSPGSDKYVLASESKDKDLGHDQESPTTSALNTSRNVQKRKEYKRRKKAQKKKDEQISGELISSWLNEWQSEPFNSAGEPQREKTESNEDFQSTVNEVGASSKLDEARDESQYEDEQASGELIFTWIEEWQDENDEQLSGELICSWINEWQGAMDGQIDKDASSLNKADTFNHMHKERNSVRHEDQETSTGLVAQMQKSQDQGDLNREKDKNSMNETKSLGYSDETKSLAHLNHASVSQGDGSPTSSSGNTSLPKQRAASSYLTTPTHQSQNKMDIHAEKDGNPTDKTKLSSRPNEESVSIEEQGIGGWARNDAFPATTAASSLRDWLSETSSFLGKHGKASHPKVPSLEEDPVLSEQQKAKLEAARKIAKEREAARLATRTSTRLSLPEIPPFRKSSVPEPAQAESTAKTSTETRSSAVSSQARTSTRANTLSPIPENSDTTIESTARSANLAALQANRSTPRNLSALAAEFVPTNTMSNRPIYTNGMPDIPSHWIPLYGRFHGTFFDPATSMIIGDGPPRRTLERADGSLPNLTDQPGPTATTENRPSPADDEDNYRIQPASFTAPYTNAHMEVDGLTLFYCFCTQRWSETRHNCPVPPHGMMASGLVSGAILPSMTLPPGWITRDIRVTDTSYLENNLAGMLTPEQQRVGTAGAGNGQGGSGSTGGNTV